MTSMHRAMSDIKSVSRDGRAAEAIVDPRGGHVDILANIDDPVRGAGCRRVIDAHSSRDKDVVGVTHEQMVVFQCNRPVGREGEFDACSNSATPALFSDLIEHDT